MDYFQTNNGSGTSTSSYSQGSDYLSSSSSSATSSKSGMNIFLVVGMILFLFIAYIFYSFYMKVLINGGHMNDTASQKISLFGSYFYNFFTSVPGSSTTDASGNSTSKTSDSSGNIFVNALNYYYGWTQPKSTDTSNNSLTKAPVAGKDASGNAVSSTQTKDASGNAVSSTQTKDASGNAVTASSPPYPNTNTTSIKQPGTSVGDQSAGQNPSNALTISLKYGGRDDHHQQQLYNLPQSQDYCADESCSVIQNGVPQSKAGWCYIGTDRGFRSCAQVSETDKCMSGQIFPSQNICVNPSLR